MDSKTVVLLMYLVGFLDLFGVSLIIPLLTKHARELGASPTMAGALGSVYGGLQLFSSPLVGRWSDISGRRYVLTCCLVLSACGYLLLGTSTSLLILLLARVPPGRSIFQDLLFMHWSVNLGMFKHSQELTRACLTDQAPLAHHSHILGVFGSVSSVGFIIGPIVGGHVGEWSNGFQTAALLTTLSFILNSGLFKHTQSITKAYLADLASTSHGGIRLAEVLGTYNAFTSGGFILGPLVGGHAAELEGGFYMIATTASLCLFVNAAIVWWFVPEVIRKKPATENDSHSNGVIDPGSSGKPKTSLNPLSALSVFWSVDWRNLWDLFLVRFLLGFAVMVSRSNFSLMLDYKYEATPKVIGYVISYGALVSTVSGFFIGRIAKAYSSDYRLLLHMSIIQVITLLAISFAPSLWVLLLCTTPLSVSTAISRVCATNLTIERGSGQETGALLGLGASMLSLARMLTPLIGGIALDMHLSGPTLMGAFCALLGVILLIVIPLSPSSKVKVQ